MHPAIKLKTVPQVLPYHPEEHRCRITDPTFPLELSQWSLVGGGSKMTTWKKPSEKITPVAQFYV